MNPDLDLLRVIKKAAEALVEHVRGYDQITFEAERKTQSAVLYEIVVVGEGVKRLSAEFRASHPEIPWKQIAGMRDRVVHLFDEVDLGLAWNVAQVHAPVLIVSLDRIAAEESNT
jgi:uncharacterized protein with HEPN domain